MVSFKRISDSMSEAVAKISGSRVLRYKAQSGYTRLAIVLELANYINCVVLADSMYVHCDVYEELKMATPTIIKVSSLISDDELKDRSQYIIYHEKDTTIFDFYDADDIEAMEEKKEKEIADMLSNIRAAMTAVNMNKTHS